MGPDGWCALPVREAVSLVKESVDLRVLAQTPHVALYSLPAYDAGAKPERASGASVGSNKFRVPRDCVLLAKLNPHIPRVWRVRHEDALPGVCSTEFWPLVPSERGQVDLDYLAHFLRSPQFLAHPLISPSSTTNSHRRIDQGAFQDFSLPLPPLPEQRKIAAILSSVDDTIEKTEAVIDQLEAVKKGLLGELLTRGMPGRLKEFRETEIGKLPESWSVAQLGDLARFVNGDRGKNYPARSAFVDVGVPFINAGHINDSAVDFTEMNFISEEVFHRLGSGKTQPNDILYCIRGSLGKTALWRGGRAAIASSLVIIRPSGRATAEYLYFYLRSPLGEAMARKLDSGSAQPNISVASLQDHRLPLPPLSEQQDVTGVLASLDDRIHCEQATLGATQAMKSALLDALLSGRVRVNVAAQEAA